MQKIHEPKKLFIGNVKITEICYRHFSKKKKKKTKKNKKKKKKKKKNKKNMLSTF